MLQSTSTFQDDLAYDTCDKNLWLMVFKKREEEIKLYSKTNYKYIMSCFSSTGMLKTITTIPQKSLSSQERLHNLAHCKVLIKRLKINIKVNDFDIQ